MKFFIVVCTSIYLYVSLSKCFVYGETVEDKDKFLAKEREGLIKCQKEGNFPEDYIDDLFIKRIVPADSKCMVKCMFHHIGWVDDDKFNVNNVIASVKQAYFDSQQYAKAVSDNYVECIESSPDEICEKSRYVLECVMKKNAKANIPVHSEHWKGG